MQTISVRGVLWLLFIRDWPWKLLSIAIALTIYFSVRSEISNLKTIAVPIMGDAGFVVTHAKPQMVYITLRGSETELEQLYTPAVYFAVQPQTKLSNAKEKNDTETIRLKSSALRQIGRLHVVRIEPSFVKVQFEPPLVAEKQPIQQPPQQASSVLTNCTLTPPAVPTPPVEPGEPNTQ